jgi:hypothetical protein
MAMEAHIQQLPQLAKRLKALEEKKKSAPASGSLKKNEKKVN